MALPPVIVTSLGVAYERCASIPEVGAGLIGAAPAAGLVVIVLVPLAVQDWMSDATFAPTSSRSRTPPPGPTSSW